MSFLFFFRKPLWEGGGCLSKNSKNKRAPKNLKGLEIGFAIRSRRRKEDSQRVSLEDWGGGPQQPCPRRYEGISRGPVRSLQREKACRREGFRIPAQGLPRSGKRVHTSGLKERKSAWI